MLRVLQWTVGCHAAHGIGTAAVKATESSSPSKGAFWGKPELAVDVEPVEQHGDKYVLAELVSQSCQGSDMVTA